MKAARKAQAVDVRDVGHDLGVQYGLEVSVRKAATRGGSRDNSMTPASGRIGVVVDVFSALGEPPRSLEDARARKAEILLANRTMQEPASIEREEALCCEIRDLMQRLPFGGLDAAESVRLKKLES